jgi:putative transposase
MGVVNLAEIWDDLGVVIAGRAVLDAGSPSYKGFRYPAEIIAYLRVAVSPLPAELPRGWELVLARGVIVSYETIRQWCAKFAPAYAAGLRRRKPRVGDKWHLDEVFVKINGERRYPWRAVDQDGNVLDVLVQSRRDAQAARRFMAKLMKKQCRGRWSPTSSAATASPTAS